ncbi:MAG: ribonuclease III [Planctomycetes bacterium]|nr:ribonuclease III [Planctomycetota bacterium]
MAADDAKITKARRRQLRALAKALGHDFADLGLLDRALTHSSMSNLGERSYERLEFLGDSFLNFAVAEVLFRSEPEVAEGRLTETRSRFVSQPPLAEVASRLGLADNLRHGKGLRQSERQSERIRADLVEAVLGAILVDGGVRSARAFVRRHVLPKRVAMPEPLQVVKDSKTALLHYCQHHKLGQPRYELVETTGLQHEQEFRVRARLDDGRNREAIGRTKRAAEKSAAALLLEKLEASIHR